MRLLSLDVTAFRNIAGAHVSPGPSLNLVVGPNGQGKTNLVEAVAFLSWLRSFRTSRSADVVARGETRAVLRAESESAGGRHEVAVEVGAGFRRARVDGHPVRSARECLGCLTVVFLSPDDPAILEGGPEGRRMLLDRALVLLDPSRSLALSRYQRLVKERNALLRQASDAPVDLDVIEACEAALADAGAQIARTRVEVLDRLFPVLAGALRDLSGLDLEVRARYASRWLAGAGTDAREALRESLRRHRPRDLAAGHTAVGPHTDDVEVHLLGLPARGHVSRGQRKALLLAWKAAETVLFAADRRESPVLILDDALSDLDPERQERLASWLVSYPGQSFLTATTAPALASADVVRLRAVEGTFRAEGMIR